MSTWQLGAKHSIRKRFTQEAPREVGSPRMARPSRVREPLLVLSSLVARGLTYRSAKVGVGHISWLKTIGRAGGIQSVDRRALLRLPPHPVRSRYAGPARRANGGRAAAVRPPRLRDGWRAGDGPVSGRCADRAEELRTECVRRSVPDAGARAGSCRYHQALPFTGLLGHAPWNAGLDRRAVGRRGVSPYSGGYGLGKMIPGHSSAGHAPPSTAVPSQEELLRRDTDGRLRIFRTRGPQADRRSIGRTPCGGSTTSRM